MLTVLPALLALVLVWVPLPFGSATAFGHSVVQATAFALLAMAVLSVPRPRLLAPAAVPAAALAAIGVLGLLQAAGWSPRWAALLGPAQLQLAMAGGETPSAVSLSMAPVASRYAALTWLAASALLLVAATVGRHRRHRRWLAGGLGAAVLFQVLYGTRAWMADSSLIWGIDVGVPSFARLRGTFINPDHLAMLLEIALAVAFAWCWFALQRSGRRDAPERRIALLAPPAAVWLMLFAALAFTGSRAGLVGAVAGTLIQGLVLLAQRRRSAAAAVLAPAAGVVLVAAIGLQAGLGRWLATSRYEVSWNDRLEVYAASVELWQRAPVLGTGLASFREAFPLSQPPMSCGTWWHAHNDILEVLVTTGLVGAAVLLAGALVALRRLAHVALHAVRTEGRAAGLAALGAAAAVGVHSFFDFGLCMPANAVAMVVVIGATLVVPTAEP